MPETMMNKEGRKSKIVMGVDDTPESLAMLKEVITGAGYTFIGVGSGADCLRLILPSQPKLVLLDIEMPEMNGIEVCRRIRALEEYDGIPIAFLTATKIGEAVRAGIAAGGNDFIIKPFDIAKLVERVGHWTARPAPRIDRHKRDILLV
jgi:two-component system OmpR family response regulator